MADDEVPHYFLVVLLGLAHPVIVISSDSESSGDEFGDSIIREWLDRRRSQHQDSSIASNMFSDSSDSNVERDYECGADGFNTEPKTSFTPSIHSEAELSRGQRPNQDSIPKPRPPLLHDRGIVKPRPRIERSPTSTRGVGFAPTLTSSAGSPEFMVADLFHMYIMSKHGRTEHRYLSTHRDKEPLIDGLPNTDKRANFYVQSQKTALSGIDIPLQTLLPEFTEMSRRNVVCMNIRDGLTARQKAADSTNPTEPVEKRQKVNHDFFPNKMPTPHPSEKERTDSSAVSGLRAVQKPVGSDDRVAVQEFAPSFALAWACSDHAPRPCFAERYEEGSRGPSAEPDPCECLPSSGLSEPNPPNFNLFTSRAYLQLFVPAGQALLRTSNKAELVTAKRSRYHEDLKAECEKVRSVKTSVKATKARVTEMEKERDEALDKAPEAERELEKIQRREKRTMKKADGKAFQVGFDRAGSEYIREARKMVNEAIKFRVPVAYQTGYKDGVKAICAVLQLEADMNLTKSIPMPKTPELVLPYTDEKSAPLPLEDYPESEDDIKDILDAEVGDGSGSKKVAEDFVVEKAVGVDGDVAMGEGQNAKANAEGENGLRD
ncbi:hypothetical protein RHMOL_Rhmol06G0106100 [Rhododendron molle]|uniref:Uncharacterized protein n=1 Tax=Rhododendron molle TaxID=49168 RepID=A0ACC0NAX7_RHOML|nr:hypothetical protein RHMOL_Rhmol06G0106100 [Rhododendron molle]